MADQQLPEERQRPDIETTLDALAHADDSTIVSSTAIYGLSHLSQDELERLYPVWHGLTVDFRRRLMEHLVDVGETDYELDYSALGNFALDDPDAAIRAAGVELMFEDESIATMDRLIEMAQWDEAPRARAAAATALGRFIYRGELGEIDEAAFSRAQDAMVSVWTNDNEDVEVRRRALESIANSSHEIVEEAIRDAYASLEHSLQVSAVFAMGRTCDTQWASIVLRELESDDPEIAYEAARAAGELELKSAVASLVRLANGSDREIAEVAIWSLGEIGGKDAMRALDAIGERATEQEDGELMEVVEDALASASMAALDLDDDWDD